jgi:hypothetical protein
MSPGLRRGIALPTVLLVLTALALLSALALTDALQASRAAALGEDAVRSRAAAIAAAPSLTQPPDLAWLCLQPPGRAVAREHRAPDGSLVRLRWWNLGHGRVRAELDARGPGGSRHRRIGWLRPDPPAAPDAGPGCPGASVLRPATTPWLTPHPEG